MDMERMLNLAGVELFEVVRFDPLPTDPTRLDTLDLSAEIDKVQKQLAAAKRGLGLANQLRDPEAKKKHKSSVFTNLNIIGNRLKSLVKVHAKAMATPSPDPYAQGPDPYANIGADVSAADAAADVGSDTTKGQV